MDADDDTIEEAIARKQARIAKRSAKKDARIRGEFDLGDSPPASRMSSESPAPKKRGRKPLNKAPEKRKVDEASLDGAAEPPKKRGRNKAIETLSKEDRNTLQTISTMSTTHYRTLKKNPRNLASLIEALSIRSLNCRQRTTILTTTS